MRGERVAACICKESWQQRARRHRAGDTFKARRDVGCFSPVGDFWYVLIVK